MKKQSGASLIAIMFGLAIGVIVLVFALKAVPFYIDNYLLKNMLDKLPEQIEKKPSVKDVKNLIDKQLGINDLDIPKEQLEVKRYGKSIDVIWPYERKVHFMSNIDLLFTFKQETTLTSE